MNFPKPMNEWPLEISTLWTMQIAYGYISSKLYEEAISKYPEYFVEELEYKRLHNSIPQEVHDAYWAEYRTWPLYESFEHPYKGMGLLWYLDHPKEYREYQEALDEYKKEHPELSQEAIWDKHYKIYGLENPYKETPEQKEIRKKKEERRERERKYLIELLNKLSNLINKKGEL